MADAARPDRQIDLITASSLDDARTEACVAHLSPDETAETTLLAISLTQSPDAWLRAFRQETDALPSRVGLVVSDVPARSAAAVDDGAGWQLPPAESVSVTTVDDPGDLTALGIKVNEFVEQWAAEGRAGDDRRLVVCFDSLTVLLQYAALDRTFRFLHVLVGQLRRHGAAAHFHLDPSTQDDRTVSTLASLFDEADVEAAGSASRARNA